MVHVSELHFACQLTSDVEGIKSHDSQAPKIALVSEAVARSLGYATLASKLIKLGSSDAPSCLEGGWQTFFETVV